MKNKIFIFFLTIFCSITMTYGTAQAETKRPFLGSIHGWSLSHDQYRLVKQYNPYLENARHLQIPQWADEDWYVEDWTSQTDGMTLIKGWYSADILRDQKTSRVGKTRLPTLVVGPNFYRLSGLDKRRVVTTVDAVYGMTSASENGSFMLTDWHTKMPIGVFDTEGLRLN